MYNSGVFQTTTIFVDSSLYKYQDRCTQKSKPHGTTTVPLPGTPYSPTVGASAVSLSDTGLPAPSAIPGPDTTVGKHDTRITNLLTSELHQLALHK